VGRGRALTSPPGLRALLLDFDGTLVDTESTVLASWLHLYEHAGHELDLDRWLDTVGGDVEARYEALAGLVGDDFDMAAGRRLRRTFELGLVGDLPLREGFGELLDRAAAARLRLAVVSSSPAEWVCGHLERLGLVERFELIVTREDALRAKPHPDLYLVALERLGLPAEAALVVEDAANGVAAAHAAGLEAVVVPNPVTVRQRHDGVPVLPDATALWAHVQQRLA
jgi:beta-phosphoglucomutase-like phosphatase (HAD superfamily)